MSIALKSIFVSRHVGLPRKKYRVFYFIAIFLMLGSVAVAFIQRQQESAAAVAVAASEVNVQRLLQEAQLWSIAGLVMVALAVLSCGIAILRHEDHHRMWVPLVVLLLLRIEFRATNGVSLS